MDDWKDICRRMGDGERITYEEYKYCFASVSESEELTRRMYDFLYPPEEGLHAVAKKPKKAGE